MANYANRLTTSQIVNIYKHVVLKLDGKWTGTEAASKLGVSVAGVSTCIKTTKAYLNGNVKTKRRATTYLRAASELRKLIRELNHPVSKYKITALNSAGEEIPSPRPDAVVLVENNPECVRVTLTRYQRLQAAIDTFESAMTDFIKEEVDSQTAPIKEENEKLKAALSGAKVGNWAENLKTHFEGKN